MEESMPMPAKQKDLINLCDDIIFESVSNIILHNTHIPFIDNNEKYCLTDFRCRYLHVWILPACFFFKALKKF